MNVCSILLVKLVSVGSRRLPFALAAMDGGVLRQKPSVFAGVCVVNSLAKAAGFRWSFAKQKLPCIIAAWTLLLCIGCPNEADPGHTHTHQWGEWAQTKAPTETVDGEETRTCALNAAHAETRPVAALGHTHQWGEWTQTTATATQSGTETRVCRRDAAHTYSRTVLVPMVFVPGGSFEMGKDLGTAAMGDVTPVHTVTVSGFHIGKYEVTQAQWQTVMGRTQQQALATTSTTNYGRSNDRPIYEVESGSDGYRLPTEAQWEYAAKGGDPIAAGWVGYTYAGSDTVGNVAWYDGNNGSSGSSTYGTKAVGTKAPNGLGLYDMSGNVYEWCRDWRGNYTSEAQTDPTGASSGSYRVWRGGCWDYLAEYVRCALRSGSDPYSRDFDFGFRLVRP